MIMKYNQNETTMHGRHGSRPQKQHGRHGSRPQKQKVRDGSGPPKREKMAALTETDQ